MSPINVLVTGLTSAPSLCLRIGDAAHPLSAAAVTAAVTAVTGLPPLSFYLRRSGSIISSTSCLTHAGEHTAFVELSFRRALPGGKGGFGATLKGSSASKATTNFDACRDLQGRRLRHVRHQHAVQQYLRDHPLPAAPQPTRDPSRKRARSVAHEPETRLSDQQQQEQQHAHAPGSHRWQDGPHDATEQVQHIDDAMHDAHRNVKEAVSAGLLAAAARKRQRVEHKREDNAPARCIGFAGESLIDSSSDSDSSETNDTAVVAKGPPLSRKNHRSSV